MYNSLKSEGYFKTFIKINTILFCELLLSKKIKNNYYFSLCNQLVHLNEFN